jgi:ribosomal protein L37E
MTVRRVLLRIVFGSLALAAGFGAAGVIFAGNDTLWRIVWTCAATAVGALLVFGSSTLLEREETWTPGVLSILLFVGEYLLNLGLIWEVFGQAQDQAGLTVLYLALTGFPALVFVGIQRRPESVVAARVGLAACAVSFVLLMIGTWGRGWGTRDFGHNHWFDVSGSLAPFAFLAVLSLIGTGLDRRHWRWPGVAAAAVAFSMATYGILLHIRETSTLFVCIVSVAVVVAHANAMVRVPLGPNQRWLLWATIASGIIAAGFVDVGRITRPWQQDMLGRLAGAAAIMAGCGTLALLVLARANRNVGLPEFSQADVHQVTLVCPRCRRKQSIAVESGRCAVCGLGIEVHLLPA